TGRGNGRDALEIRPGVAPGRRKSVGCRHMAHRSPPMAEPRFGRADALGLALVLVLALAIRLGLAAANRGLTMDSPLYVRMAEPRLAGRRGPSPAHHGSPAIVALASLVVPGRELPGRVVSLAASLLVVALAWWIARRRKGSVAAQGAMPAPSPQAGRAPA